MAISSDTAHSLLWSGYFQTPDFGMTLMQSRAVACDLLGSLGRAMHRPWGWRNSFWKHQAVAVSCGWWTCCEEFCGTRLALICRYHQDARNSEGALGWPCVVNENPPKLIGKMTREATHPVNAATQPSSAKVDT